MTGKRFFLLFFLCAFVPLAAAKLSLSYGWFNKSAANKGQWLEHEIKLIPAIANGDMHWSIAYVTTKTCESNCVEALNLLQQLYTGLGRKQLGVQALLVTTDASNVDIVKQFSPAIKTEVARKNMELQLATLQQHFVIINQQGVALLQYSTTEKLPVPIAADIRSDLLRLLNYDRSRL
ncbi:MAG: hypothetical protein B0W54_10880 [Cellvibrio sp. 79]|nr:MAG: hypothetical protein B0W54_10880 [Cellvibrio sp. 79]